MRNLIILVTNNSGFTEFAYIPIRPNTNPFICDLQPGRENIVIY